MSLDPRTEEAIKEAFAGQKCLCGKQAVRYVQDRYYCEDCFEVRELLRIRISADENYQPPSATDKARHRKGKDVGNV